MLPENQTALFCRALKAVNAGVVLLDGQQKIVFWNDWMERYSLIPEKNALEKTLSELCPDLQSARLQHAISHALNSRLPSILSQTLNKAPLPLFATQQHADALTRMQQAIQVLPISILPASTFCMIQVTDVSAAVNRESILRHQAVELRSKAHIDGLTGIANRRRFNEHGEESFRHAKRNGKTLSLIMIDIDFFKTYNDHYGHQKGDLCLIEVAAALVKGASRPFDLVARYGGEEFVIVLPDTGADGAQHIANNTRLCVEELCIEHAGSGNADMVTVSLGIATFIPEQQPALEFAGLINQADQALYRAKESGRNRAAFFSENPPGQ